MKVVSSTSTKFVQKLRELNKGKHIKGNKQGPTGPYEAVEDHTGPYWTIRHYKVLYRTIQDQRGTYGTIQDHMGLYGTLGP